MMITMIMTTMIITMIIMMTGKKPGGQYLSAVVGAGPVPLLTYE